MQDNTLNIAINESSSSEDVILNLIETARTLRVADEKQSVEFFRKAFSLSRNAQFASGMAESLYELATIHQKNGETGEAINCFHDAVGVFEKAGSLLRCCECLQQLAEICYKSGNYQQALESRLKGLQYSKTSGDLKTIATIYNSIGDVYKALGDFEKAIENHQHALKIFESLNDQPMLSITNFYIGNCYNWWNKMEEAYTFLDKSLKIADELKDPALQVKPTGSLAILFTKLKEYDKSMEYFFHAIDYVNLTGDLLLKADLLKSFGNLFIEKKEFERAIQVLLESMAIAEKLSNKYPLNLIHKFLADAYEKSGEYEKALNHYKLFTSISGELMNEEVALKTKGIQLQYDLEETRREKDLIEKAVLHKDQFIANISHEIRTPLNGVLGMSNLLADTNPTAEQLEYINTIKLSANNLISIINDILDFSKIHSGEVSFDSNEICLREFISGIAQVVKIKADEKGLKINLSFDENIPDVVIGDATRLNQVLLHLFNNAVKFTEKGSISIVAQVLESKDLTAKILFTISDTGIGISEKNINYIFESFKQLNHDNQLYSGTGLGLSIVKQLVDLQGGSISVNSKLGEGSVFKIELPFKLLAPIKKGSSGEGSRNEVAITDLSQVKLLLVEDNKVNQFLAVKLLTKMGFVVEIANDGKEAITLLSTKGFDVILMDVQMPEMNGYELTQVIRTSLPSPASQIPIIALTAYASNQEKEKAMAMGMSDYITKPYSPHELLTAVLKQVRVKENRTTSGKRNSNSITAEDVRESSEKLVQLFSGSIDDVLSLLHMLVGQIPQLISEASQHVNEKNWPATFQSIHKLKSSVNLLKINLLKDSVSELEEFSRDQIHTEKIPPVFESFKAACDQTVSLLKDEIIRLKKST